MTTGAAEPFQCPPLGVLGTIALFAIPTLYFLVVVFIGVPVLLAAGLHVLVAFPLAMTVCWVTMLAVIWALVTLEGVPRTLPALRARFRFGAFRWTHGAVGLAAALVAYLGYQALSPTIAWLSQMPLLGAHPWLYSFSITAYSGQGGLWYAALAANAYLVLGSAFINEAWARGYILPRQERSLGAHAWWVHGLLWNLCLLGMNHHELIAVLPLSLALAWVAQRMQSTWPALVAHLTLTLGNLIYIVLFVS